jgi:formylglycine-generating enzyme required for sulfatase activity
MGVSVPPAIEGVVRHALEKEVSDRISSVPEFLRELHAALNSSPVVATALRETVAMDPNRTIASITQPPGSMVKAPDLSATNPPVSQDTHVGDAFDSLAGAISATDVDKVIVDDAQRKRREEDERISKEQEDRDRREREQHEKLERMALQAQELEDRLERLSGSMPPALDPETTRVRANATNADRVVNQAQPQSVGPGKPMIVDFSPRRKTSPLLFIGIAAVVLVFAGAGIAAYLMIRSRSQVVPPTASPSPVPSPKAKADLVTIDGGTFLMGRNSGPPQETPAHAVNVLPFMMDRTEVSNTEYADFVRDTNHVAPTHWVGNKPPFGQELWPVVNVSVEDATAFAAWRSKRDGSHYRLPTEEEWEYAARNGEQGDLYPWGTTWRDDAAVLKDATPAAVGSHPGGKNRWGVLDLIGNVWEWTSSKASVYPGNRAVVPGSMVDWVTIRGGCYVSDPTKADAPVSSCLREFVPASTKTTLLGFRLVRSGS